MIVGSGVGARLKALLDVVNGTLVPGVVSLPWKVTGLPAVYEATTGASAIPITVIGMAAVKTTLAANTTLQTLVDITGSGVLRHATIVGPDIGGVMRMRITVDGVELADATGTYAGQNRWMSVVGRATILAYSEWEVPYRSSLKIECQQTAVSSAYLVFTNILSEPYTA